MTPGDPYTEDRVPAAEPTAASRRTSSVNLPTVLASAGVAAVVAAIIVTIGVVGLVISGDIGGDDKDSAAQTPTVVNLGAARSSVAAGQAPAAPQPGTSTVPPAAGQPPAAQQAGEQVAESGGGAGAGNAPVGQAPAQQAPAQQAPARQAAPSALPAAAPQALTVGQLNTKIKLLMNTGASRAARANELQAGARGLGSVDGVANLLRISGAGFTYQMIDPVTVNGTTMSATLQMTLVGQGSKTQPLKWVWSGSDWKLSNKSTCDVAGLALLPCSI